MDEVPLTDAALRALLARATATGEPPEAGLLAAWLDRSLEGSLEGSLDGQRDEAASARIEAWLASDALARAAVHALRDAAAAPVPDAELARLRALVPAGPAAAARRGAGWRAALDAWLPSPRVAIASVALVALAAWLGLAAGERLAEAHWAREARAALPGAVLLDPGA